MEIEKQIPKNKQEEIHVSAWHRMIADRPKTVIGIVVAVTVVLVAIGQAISPLKIDASTNGFRTRGTTISLRENQFKLLNRPVENGKTKLYSGTYPNLYRNCNPKKLHGTCEKLNRLEEDNNRRLAVAMEGTASEYDIHSNRAGVMHSHRRLFNEGNCNTEDKHERDNLYLLFVAKDEKSNVITKEVLQTMCTIEQKVVAHSGYESNCLKVSRQHYTGQLADRDTCMCANPTSLLHLIPRVNYTDISEVDCKSITDADVVYIQTSITQCCKSSGKACFTSNPVTDPALGKRCQLLANLESGYPYAQDFPGSDVNKGTSFGLRVEFPLSFQDRNALFTYVNALVKDVLGPEFEANDARSTFNVLYATKNNRYRGRLQNAALLADMGLAVGAIVVVFVLVLFQTNQGSITSLGMLHITLSLPVSYTIYKIFIDWFPFMCFLGMFVILGIGADDIFVYSDAWKQSYVEIPDANKQERVAWVFNRASKAMLITSVTTAVAFVANVVSPCAPLRLFGIFMAILVMVDYIFVITMFPAVIVIFHKEHASLFSCCGKDAVCTTDGDVKEHTPRLIESFFRGAFTTFVLKWKWIFIFIGFGVIGAAGWKSTQFPMPTDSIKLFPDSHPLMIAEKANMQLFAPSSDPYVEAYLAWGLIPSDTGNFNEDKARGELKLDDTFDMSQHATQVFLLDFENNMRAKIPNAVRNETFLSNGILKFNTWLLQNRSINHPVDKSCSNGMDLKQDVRTGAAFSTCLMQFLDDESAPYHGFIIDDNQKVRAYMMAFTSTVTKANRMVFDPMRKFYDEVNTYMEQTNNNAGASYNKGYITDYGLLGWNDLLKNFSSSGYISAGLSIGLAYIVLLMTTQNFRVSSFAIVSIYGIIGCVMSILILLGWEMGMLESMCMSILAGVAVDFVIHIGHAYIEGMTENRTENVRNALGALGISVISAGVTTLASALLLFGCTITFFSKFGTFLSLAMVTSLSFAFFLYPPILGVCGPVKGGAMGGHF